MLNNPLEPSKEILGMYGLLLGQQESSFFSKPELEISVSGAAEIPRLTEAARVHGLITSEPVRFEPLSGIDPVLPTQFVFMRIVDVALPSPVFFDDEEAR